MSNQYVAGIISGLNFIFSQMEDASASMFDHFCLDSAINPHAILNNNKHPEEYVDVPFYVHWKDKNSTYIACNNLVAHDVGHNTNTMKGSTDFDFHFLTETQIHCYREHDALVRSTGKAQFFLEPITCVNGSNSITIAYKSPLMLRSNKIVGTKCIAFMFNQEVSTDKNPGAKSLVNPTIVKKTPQLSARQIDCLYYMVKGMTSKQIANTLNLSPRTIEHYLDTIKIKLNCINKAELIACALQMPVIKNRL